MQTGEPLGSIPGVVPRMPPGFVGCGFRDRCTLAMPECAQPVPLRNAGRNHCYLCRLPPDWKRATAA
jgi:peptide/nickel transport system ATP-binding protein